MANPRMTLLDLLNKAEQGADPDFLRDGLKLLGVGTIELEIPKLRAGTYFPSLLEPRRRHERALLSVVQEAYIHGVSTRAVDALAEALGLKGISKDQVSRICKELDAQVHAFRTDPSTPSTPT
jgi:putative transposase